MFQHQGIWLPDGEKHFPEWMDENGEIVDERGTYQIRKWRACLPWIRRWRRAVDVGAHVGFWSIQMVAKFERVAAFEPCETFRACWEKNVAAREQDELYGCALGAERGVCDLNYDPADSGGTHVARTDGGAIPMLRLDTFGFTDVDFVKIDCEGFEHKVIEGARRTLAECRPCVIVEQKPHKLGPNFGIEGTPACDLLREMGALMRTAIGGDYIFSWDDVRSG